MVNTASMAGLVAGPGTSACSASKYAVVALTEAIRAELAAEGGSVGLSVLTPAQVKSNIGENALKRPGPQGGAPRGSNDDHLPPGNRLEADEAARIILDGVRRNDLYIITHPEEFPPTSARHEHITQAYTTAAAR